MKIQRENSGVTLVTFVLIIVSLIIVASIIILSIVIFRTQKEDEIANLETVTESTGSNNASTTLKIKVSNQTITNGRGEEVEAESQEVGTTLYINFDSKIEGGTTTVEPALPYAITENGTYTFTITGTADDNVITRTYSVSVNKYASNELVVASSSIKVGDYVDYTPSSSSTYTKENLSEEYTGSASNTEDIQQDDLVWQILRIYDDGSVDLIGSATEQKVYLQGAVGYNNSVYLLNDICEKLYSNEEHNVVARSVEYEDMESWLTITAKAIRDSYKSTEKGAVAYGATTSYRNHYYPELYVKENGSGIDQKYATDITTNGIGVSEKYYTSISQLSKADTAYLQAETLVVTQTGWKCNMNSTNFGNGAKVFASRDLYYIASRCVETGAVAKYNIRISGETTIDSEVEDVFQSTTLFESSNTTDYEASAVLRPVVTISGDVEIDGCIGENSKTNMHTINW